MENIEENQESSQALVQQPDFDVEGSKEKKKEKKFPNLLIYIFAFIFLFNLGAVGFYFFQQKPTSKLQPSPVPSEIPVVSPALTPTSESTVPADWKTYINEQIGYTIKYPPEMIPSRGNCDSFILPDSEKEREDVQSIRDSGIEIGYTIEGLELAFCKMSNPDGLGIEDFAKKHTPNAKFESVSLNRHKGLKTTTGALQKSFTEFFINSPDKGLVRIWYRYGQGKYQTIASQILSTFEFLGK